jgi:hypothetical protein
MPDFDAAFDALEHLDDKARQALELSGAMYEELYREVEDRVRKAEWLLERLHARASQRGVVFDLAAASEYWDGRHPRPKMPLTSRYHTLLLERDNEARNLQRLLDDAADEREQAEIRAETAERERVALRAELVRILDEREAAEIRAEAAERERDALRAELGRAQATPRIPPSTPPSPNRRPTRS